MTTALLFALHRHKLHRGDCNCHIPVLFRHTIEALVQTFGTIQFTTVLIQRARIMCGSGSEPRIFELSVVKWRSTSGSLRLPETIYLHNAIRWFQDSSLGMDHMITLTEIIYDLDVRPHFSMDDSIDGAHFLVYRAIRKERVVLTLTRRSRQRWQPFRLFLW
jgi:hypothetical protein